MKDNARKFKDDEIERSKTFTAKNDFVNFIAGMKKTKVPELADKTDVDGKGLCWVDFKAKTDEADFKKSQEWKELDNKHRILIDYLIEA